MLAYVPVVVYMPILCPPNAPEDNPEAVPAPELPAAHLGGAELELAAMDGEFDDEFAWAIIAWNEGEGT